MRDSGRDNLGRGVPGPGSLTVLGTEPLLVHAGSQTCGRHSTPTRGTLEIGPRSGVLVTTLGG